jgi:hypothetical protein
MITKYNQFCDWDCQSNLDAVIMIMLLITGLGATMYCCTTYMKIIRRGKIKKELHKKFIAMVCWGVSIAYIM